MRTTGIGPDGPARRAPLRRQSLRLACVATFAATFAALASQAFGQVQLPRGEPGLPPPSGQAAAAAQSGAATGGIPPAPFGGHQFGAPSATLPDLPGVLPWQLLGTVKIVQSRDRFVPEYPPSVARLDGKEVKVQGFMLPLEAGDRQKHFLLTSTPQTCAFCVPAGPEGIVEVRTRSPVRVTFDPIVVSGRFEVLKDDPMGVFYRIGNGEPVAR
jgi:uncharacterized protein